RAREHYSAALEQAAKTDAEETKANATWGLGLVLWNLGRWGEAHDRLRALQELADRRADKMAALGASANLGPLLAALGDTAQARKELGIARQQSVAAANRANEAFAIDYLAAVAEQEGELQEARKLFGEALDLRREIEHRAGIVETLVGLGRLTLGQGSPEGARPYLEEARDLANEIGVPGMCSLACAHLSALPGADTRAIVKEFEAGENHLDARRKIEARYALWQATHDAAHLEEAHRILAEVRDHAPEESREAMIEMVPLHKAIMAEHEEQRR
ncbi:MAG: tetratricopeptide repeat protein, partial [Planctomycetota bacterium]